MYFTTMNITETKSKRKHEIREGEEEHKGNVTYKVIIQLSCQVEAHGY